MSPGSNAQNVNHQRVPNPQSYICPRAAHEKQYATPFSLVYMLLLQQRMTNQDRKVVGDEAGACFHDTVQLNVPAPGVVTA